MNSLLRHLKASQVWILSDPILFSPKSHSTYAATFESSRREPTVNRISNTAACRLNLHF